MSKQLKEHVPSKELSGYHRPVWRQRLVEAERGITHGLRGDSTFYVHFFIGSVILATAIVLGISLLNWIVLVLALTMVLSVEMLNQVLKAILLGSASHELDQSARKALRMGTAAVFVAMIGAGLTTALIFGQRLIQMFAE